MLSYTRQILCQAENTLTIALILSAFYASIVEIFVEKLWIKMWIMDEGF